MRKIANLLSVLFVFFFLEVAAFAKLKVVSTLPSFNDIAVNVGGDDVEAISLTKFSQDPHFVDAKPDLILRLNQADLLLRTGLGLEDGWLPSILTGSRNGKIQVGSDGNFDISSVMQLKDIPTVVDRSQGDVHPGGNPHFMLDPRNGVVLARALAERLARLEPSKADQFRKRAESYSKQLLSHITNWEKALARFKEAPIVTYHRSWIYFSSWIGAKEVGYIEPKPGIPPSPDHMVRLIQLMKEKKVSLILMEPYYPKGSAEDVARQVGAKVFVLPSERTSMEKASTYFSVFEEIVAVLTAPKSGA